MDTFFVMYHLSKSLQSFADGQHPPHLSQVIFDRESGHVEGSWHTRHHHISIQEGLQVHEEEPNGEKHPDWGGPQAQGVLGGQQRVHVVHDCKEVFDQHPDDCHVLIQHALYLCCVRPFRTSDDVHACGVCAVSCKQSIRNSVSAHA